VKRWHLLTPEYPPCCGGVGDYTALLAAGLASAGDRVDVWHADKVAAKPCSALNIHALPDRFGPRSRQLLNDAFVTDPGIVLVQYVPSAFGRRGFNWPFCRWIGELGQSGADVRVMFHEPFFYFTVKRPWRNALAIAQRGMAATLLRAASHVYYSTSTWTRLLAPYGSPDAAEVLPIPATIPTDVRARPEPDALKKRCGEFRVGHFGTYGEHVAGQLRPVLPLLLEKVANARVLLVGRGSEAFARTLEPDVRSRVLPTGNLEGASVATALRTCDVLLQPYPDGVTTRRTSMMAALTTGVPVVTTSGALTEPVWMETNAVALPQAGNHAAIAGEVVRFAQDAARRADYGARGRRLYDEQFALCVTLSRLRR
jgi:glycosyltransferase involved in cell wall biosynthesis